MFFIGFAYALFFVNIVFITLQNTMVGYTGLYALASMISNPGECDPSYTEPCIPYNQIGKLQSLLVDRSIWLEKHFVHERNPWANVPKYLSTELFFKHYIYHWRINKGSKTDSSFHWRFVLVFVVALVCAIPTSLQTYLVSTLSRVRLLSFY
jgi:hypothetical protein